MSIVRGREREEPFAVSRRVKGYKLDKLAEQLKQHHKGNDSTGPTGSYETSSQPKQATDGSAGTTDNTEAASRTSGNVFTQNHRPNPHVDPPETSAGSSNGALVSFEAGPGIDPLARSPPRAVQRYLCSGSSSSSLMVDPSRSAEAAPVPGLGPQPLSHAETMQQLAKTCSSLNRCRRSPARTELVANAPLTRALGRRKWITAATLVRIAGKQGQDKSCRGRNPKFPTKTCREAAGTYRCASELHKTKRTPAAVRAAQNADSHLRDVRCFDGVVYESMTPVSHHAGVGLLNDDDDDNVLL
ncbi:hypothetical protein B0H14DRAFT_2605161 [Mycena olivaceomarginata]|nr:hypothetical protein B0H14DRAFT_2605161 [Mycena olivaceomarginata]